MTPDQEALVLAHLGHVRRLTGQYRWAPWYDDTIGAAHLALVEAALLYEEGRVPNFWAFAYLRVVGAVKSVMRQWPLYGPKHLETRAVQVGEQILAAQGWEDQALRLREILLDLLQLQQRAGLTPLEQEAVQAYLTGGSGRYWQADGARDLRSIKRYALAKLRRATHTAGEMHP